MNKCLCRRCSRPWTETHVCEVMPDATHYAIAPGIYICGGRDGSEVYHHDDRRVDCKECLKLLKKRAREEAALENMIGRCLP